MKTRYHPVARLMAVALTAAIALPAAEPPIQIHPANPHYLLWRGKPTVLITAGEHYGAVMNLDFDYARYLGELRKNQFNLTRVFSGSYREISGSFNIQGNTLAPAPGRYVGPWARSSTPGANDGGNKFDLARWDPAYFQRLTNFVGQASAQGVVVELVLFCTMYDDTIWKASPMHPSNNVNLRGDIGRSEVYNGKSPDLLALQKALAAKLVAELNPFANVYFEICNEPYERGGLTQAWNDQIIATIAATEAGLPNQHLIAQGFPPVSEPIAQLNPRVSILNFHAATPESVRLNRTWNRVLAFDETGGSDRSDRKYRTEGWDWIIAGGAVYDHLDFSFQTDRPDGSGVPLPAGTPGGGGPALRRQLSILKEFIDGFDLVRLKPDEHTLKGSRVTGTVGASKATARVLSDPGQAYAIYVNGGTRAELVVDLPPAAYTVAWINPKTGQVERTESFTHAGGQRTLGSPEYSEDIALRVTRRTSVRSSKPPPAIAEFFRAPEKYRSDFGSFRSPLLFTNGVPVRSASDWHRRREEILSTWHRLMGPWPALIDQPRVEIVNTMRRDQITQHQLRLQIALGGEMMDALLLVPEGATHEHRRPAVLVVYYDAETGAGLGAPERDYAWQLARRGLVALSLGKPNAQIDLASTNKPRTDPYLGPVGAPVRVQPLSALAYAAANAHTVLAQRPEVRPDRIGIAGHSFGGKWAMFASCLYDKFAAAVWSDPGIVFDERDRRKQNPGGSVNYWDVWYLGFESGRIADPKNAGPFRRLPSEGDPRTGAYRALIEGGHDLVELHALMAPRPFLVSGGTADLPERWTALNHSVAVNQLLGYQERVALTARDGHSPNETANDQVYRFFEWSLGSEAGE